MREDDRAQHVVVPVQRVDAVQERNLEARLLRVALIVVVHVGPSLQAVAGLGIRVAAAQQRAEEQVLDVGRILQRANVGLGHLADLLFEGHFGEELLSLRVIGR